jgi:ribosome maturation factor RimP
VEGQRKMSISSPKFLTKQIHIIVLEKLRVALSLMKSTKSLSEEMNKIRIRNWLFLIEEGIPTVDIILDKGYNPADVEKNILPRVANSSLSFDECAEIHEFILSTDALDDISDDVSVRFGTPGSEPTLFEKEDFQASVNNMVRLETWEPKDGRTKFTMILVDIFEKEGNSVAVVSEGSKRFEIPLDDIKSAFVLPFHPASKSMKSAKKGSTKTKTK